MTGKTHVPDGWRLARLGDVVTLQRGFDLPVQDRLHGAIPLYGSNGVLGYHANSSQKGPGVITGRSGSIGIVYYSEGPYWPLNTTLYIRDFQGNNERYIYHFLSHLGLERFAASTGVPSLNRNFVHPYLVVIPPLGEQRRITAVLDAIDDAIKGTEAVIAATERLRDALLHELLTRGVPGQHSEWKEAPGLGTIPACWDVVRLGDVAEVLDARRIPLNSNDRAKIPGKYPYYGANGIVDYIDRWIFDEVEDLILLAEDGGHFDEFNTRPIAYRVNGRCWVNNHAHVLKAKNRGWGGFTFYSLVHKDIRLFINGTTRSKLTQADLLQIEIGFPSDLNEVMAIAALLDSVNEAIEHGRTQTNMLKSLKASAVDALLTGRVRVPLGG